MAAVAGEVVDLTFGHQAAIEDVADRHGLAILGQRRAQFGSGRGDGFERGAGDQLRALVGDAAGLEVVKPMERRRLREAMLQDGHGGQHDRAIGHRRSLIGQTRPFENGCVHVKRPPNVYQEPRM